MEPRLAELRSQTDLTEADLQYVLAIRGVAVQQGDRAMEGWCMLTLSHLVKWVRSDTPESPFERADSAAAEALEIFRETGDAKGLLAALLAATSPFRPPMLNELLLNEAEALAEQQNDELAKAKVMRRRAGLLSRKHPEEGRQLTYRALEICQKLGDEEGTARCFWGLALTTGEWPERRENARAAADLFQRLGHKAEAARALCLAAMFAKELPLDEKEELAHQCIQACKEAPVKQPIAALRLLVEVYETRGDTDRAAHYREIAEAAEEEREQFLNSDAPTSKAIGEIIKGDE